MNNDALLSIVNRTKGEFFIGVVGSVRSGKSTFIKRFIEIKALPYINDEFLKNKVIDELPQSSAGKQIMTVEPKFVPQAALPLVINEETTINMRLVDSVGYVIPSAIGYSTEEGPRLVKTPWLEEPIPFKDAAELGTKKVIQNHSNIGIIITSDGSFGDFSRSDYEANERILIEELQSLEKPFVVVLNSATPNSNEAQIIKNSIEKNYDIPVLCINVIEMTDSDIDRILSKALEEFPISELDIKLPSWLSALDSTFSIKNSFNEAIDEATKAFKKFKHIEKIKAALSKNSEFKEVTISSIDPSIGKAEIKICCDDSLYYSILDDIFEEKIETRGDFIRILQEMKIGKKEYDNIKQALECVKQTGYGVSLPNKEEMTLAKPEVIKQGSRYGIKLKAIAPSIHMIKVDVESTFEPIIGSEEQSKNLMNSMDKDDIWDQEIFGRSISEVVNDGIKAKIHTIPEGAKAKFRETLEKIVNNGNGGLIAIIL